MFKALTARVSALGNNNQRILSHLQAFPTKASSYFLSTASSKMPTSNNIKIYGHPVSQPSRAVFWLLQIQDFPYSYQKTDPVAGDTKTPEFLQLNPTGLIPVLTDADEELVLFESAAILVYLCEKNGWESWFPSSSIVTRAKINQYLNWHHSNTRKSSLTFKNLILAVVGKGTEKNKEALLKRQENLAPIMSILESYWLNGPHEYIATASSPTVADIVCYCELDQLEATNLFDFSPYPNLIQWMTRMKSLPKHDEVRKSLSRLASIVREKNIVPTNSRL